MPTIELTKGRVTTVDEADYDFLMQWSWHWHNGYAKRGYRDNGVRKGVFMHRALLGAQPPLFVDHINGDKLDNRRENLRLVTKLQNCQNIRSSRNQKKGGFKGVSLDAKRGKWCAYIRIPGPARQGRSKYLGAYLTAVEAAMAYDAAAGELFGEFAAFNFPEAERLRQSGKP